MKKKLQSQGWVGGLKNLEGVTHRVEGEQTDLRALVVAPELNDVVARDIREGAGRDEGGSLEVRSLRPA